MTGRIVKQGRHQCDPLSHGRHGDIWECDECGRHWRYTSTDGNPAYDRWRMTIRSTLGLHRRPTKHGVNGMHPVTAQLLADERAHTAAQAEVDRRPADPPPRCPRCGTPGVINWIDCGYPDDTSERIAGSVSCPNPDCPAQPS